MTDNKYGDTLEEMAATAYDMANNGDFDGAQDVFEDMGVNENKDTSKKAKVAFIKAIFDGFDLNASEEAIDFVYRRVESNVDNSPWSTVAEGWYYMVGDFAEFADLIKAQPEF